MNILVINGSPKDERSNTLRLTDAFSLDIYKTNGGAHHPAAYRGANIVFDIDYTDIGKRYRVILGEKQGRVTTEFDGRPATVIHTPFSVWREIAAGKIEGSAVV